MPTLFLRPLRQCAQALMAIDSPRQIAAAATLGMAVGLLPKSNLIAIGLGCLLLGLRVNRPAGLAALGVFAWLGPRWDAFADRAGRLVLGWPPAREFFTWLYERPLGPLLGFSNTVCLGQLLIGLYLAYPTYAATYALAARFQPPLRAWLTRRRALRWLYGAEVGAQWGIDS